MEINVTKEVFEKAVSVNGQVSYERKWTVLQKVLGHIFFLLCRAETYIEREYWKKTKYPKLDEKDFFQAFLKADKRKWPVARILYEASKYVTFLKHNAMEWTAIEAIYTENEWLKKEMSWWERVITSVLCRVENIVATRNRLRNTKREMFWEVINLVKMNDNPIRIVSLASGSARSSIEVVSALLNVHPELLDRFQLWFVDWDPKAYDFAKELASKNFPGLENKIEFWKTKISGKADGLVKLGTFLAKVKPHIVEMVGFGDYMTDEKAIGIFKTILENLEPDGLLITNNVKPNDEQHFLETVVTWTMINREEREVLENLSKAGFYVVKTLNEPTDIQPVYAARKVGA